MEKNIKDYLHLFVGGYAMCKDGSDIDRLKIDGILIDTFSQWEYVKPILRPLSDMTEEERKEADDARGESDGCDNFSVPEAYEFKYLLSKHFDLFGLIESGLAIDKTKL